jgi:DNA-binding MarR family transcriptional regulator
MSVPDQTVRASRSTAPARKARTAGKALRSLPSPTGASHPVSLKRLKSLAGYLIRQAQLWVFEDFNETLAPLDIRPVQYSILTVIRENPGLSQMALSQVLGIVRSGVVPLLDGLESRGLLKRTAHASDRRSHALRLTTDGNALLKRADALVQQHENRLIQKVGPRGHKQLIEILKVFGKRDELK